ncbi:sigma-70 family RNA polymerase sigma factor [Clostridium sp. DJ247]|uniref:sigma-70 family RNA polymerase sigma factor n=1 Tax=Clostridium sp. DJ247 TaxID=2726188 RepID=UPI001627766D|nr:sigma-70 family RNA polymerase sigma factor [Clostridium sp. DJ247]MBC2579696.1 sigma-70 family RNA polymerase sigma factor [Clostridium sp. DJ247]
MIDKETSKKIERNIYNYYEKKEIIKSIKYKIEKLEEQVKQIEAVIKGNNVVIEEGYKSITYEEKVQYSSDGTSYVERELIKAIERLEREKDYKLAKISDLKKEIREIEESFAEIEYNIKMLKDEDLKFLELKYKVKPKLSVEIVASRLNMSRSTAYDKRGKLINEIAKWCSGVK